LIINLKKQFNELKKEYKIKCDQYENLKKSSKSTKINELIIENRELSEEVFKLKNFYDISIQQNIFNENKLVEYSNIQENFNKQQFTLIAYQENLKKLELDLISKDNEIKRLNDIIYEKSQTSFKIKKDMSLNMLKSVDSSRVNSINKEIINYKSEAETNGYKKKLNYMNIDDSNNNSEKKKFISNFDESNNISLLKSKLQEANFQNDSLEKKNKELEEKLKNFENAYQSSTSSTQWIRNRLNYELLNEDQMNEMIYILIKNLEANKIDYHILDLRLFSNISTTFIESKQFLDELSSSFITILDM
jgi:hypothetical protein